MLAAQFVLGFVMAVSHNAFGHSVKICEMLPSLLAVFMHYIFRTHIMNSKYHVFSACG
jgi:hypothetical protein